MSHDQLWEQGLEQLGCQPDESQLAQLKQYVELLNRWNKTYNLTAVREIQDMIPLHIFDSLVVADFIKGDNCLDVGSGAGLPTIPLAIIQPDREFMAVDTNGKKTRFIQQAIIELGLKNAKVSQARIESLDSEIKYDAIISRAFASVFDFLEGSSDQLASGGTLYAMKGQYPTGELQYIPKKYTLTQSHSMEVPFVDGERHLLEFTMSQTTA